MNDEASLGVAELLSRYAPGNRSFAHTNLQGDLSGADLQGSNFSDAFLVCGFRGANLRGARFCSANVKTCDFSEADLTDADFTGAVLDGADFKGATVAGARFAGAYDPGVRYEEGDLPQV